MNTFITAEGCHFNASQFGVQLNARTKAVFENCQATSNLQQGIFLSAPTGSAEAQINGCSIFDNGSVGISCAGANAVARISLCTIFGNVIGINRPTGGQIYSVGNNRIRGNTTNGTPTSVIGGD